MPLGQAPGRACDQGPQVPCLGATSCHSWTWFADGQGEQMPQSSPAGRGSDHAGTLFRCQHDLILPSSLPGELEFRIPILQTSKPRLRGTETCRRTPSWQAATPGPDLGPLPSAPEPPLSTVIQAADPQPGRPDPTHPEGEGCAHRHTFPESTPSLGGRPSDIQKTSQFTPKPATYRLDTFNF